MIKKIKTFCVLFALLLGVWIINSCKKKEKELDEELFELAQETAGFVWYKNSSSLLSKSCGSRHSQTFLRITCN